MLGKKEKPKFKVAPIRIPSDDCVVHAGRRFEGKEIVDEGTPFYPHQNEWVEVLPIGTIREYISYINLRNFSLSPVSDPLEELCEELSNRITAWNWTGMDSKPLTQPYQNKQVIRRLTDEEILWLVTAFQGETKGERKNA